MRLARSWGVGAAQVGTDSLLVFHGRFVPNPPAFDFIRPSRPYRGHALSSDRSDRWRALAHWSLFPVTFLEVFSWLRYFSEAWFVTNR